MRQGATDISMVAEAREANEGIYTLSQAIRVTVTNPVLRELQAKLDLPGLEHKLRKDLKGNSQSFFDLARKLVEAKYQKTDVAFRVFSCPKDNMMSSSQFQELCDSLGLCIEPRIQKSLFDMTISKDSEMAWSFADFQDVLVAAKLHHIRSRVSAYNNSVMHIGKHIDIFIKRLALEAGENSRRRAVARLQKKVDLPFCVEVQLGLQRTAQRAGKFRAAENLISADDFVHVIDIATMLQSYEIGMMRNIYDRIDRSRCGSVNMSDLIVALTLLASEGTDTETMRKEKLQFLFTVFDADDDGCVTFEEILRLYCSIAIFSTIARGDQPSYDADVALGDELSLSKARRMYDFTLVYLRQNGVEDLCTFEELWSVFDAFPSVMAELIPGTFSNSIMWVLRSLPPLRVEETSKRNTTTSISQPPARTVRSPSTKFRKPTMSACAPHVGAALEKSRRPSSRQMQSRTERFRVQAAIRFRHAVRGEWDVVNALQNAPPQSSEGSRSTLCPAHASSSSHLPSLANSVSAPVLPTSARSSARPIVSREKPAVKWSEAASKFDRRQKESDWRLSHRQSITNWTKGPDEEQHTLSKQSRSLPNLAKKQFSSQNAKENIAAATQAKIGEIYGQEAKVLDALPMEQVRFGREALTRINLGCKALQSGGQQVGPVVVEHVEYDCKLCRGRHDVSARYGA
jgi:Ca2+-binding EF-hand superfamily protein